ncbi:FcoT family thioesterase [Streptomyces sp. AM 4-1-1]|uniref:FcoT family thioesterase n=1 Tax=Streptomyces sp. AM 4-1-1 TaxID=3028710 RepID=UPI0023B972B0|nr:FcoT family thioesterase [Streptomyces sp. AM 4-1-1]WEH36338.1 FcoT family thioesterase [Streptomyces sp. AM 4-1-1]
MTQPGTGAVGFGTDDALLAQVLRPYRQNCQYLKSAGLKVLDASEGPGLVTADCEFEIPESCYIDDTGHFNSVEFNICYNQMLYYTVAKVVQERLVEPLSAWTMEDYWARQLADFLITDFRSSFKRAMRGGRFSGDITLLDVVEWEGDDLREPLLVLHTSCRYWDENGGNCHGDVRVAITHPTTHQTPS